MDPQPIPWAEIIALFPKCSPASTMAIPVADNEEYRDLVIYLVQRSKKENA